MLSKKNLSNKLPPDNPRKKTPRNPKQLPRNCIKKLLKRVQKSYKIHPRNPPKIRKKTQLKLLSTGSAAWPAQLPGMPCCSAAELPDLLGCMACPSVQLPGLHSCLAC